MSLMSMRRKMVSRKTVTVVLWVLIIGFLVGIVILSIPAGAPRTGAADKYGADGARVIATVGGEKITLADFEEAYAKQAEQANYPPEVDTVLSMREYAFNGLVNSKQEELVRKKLKAKATDKDIRATMRNVAEAMVADASVRASFQFQANAKDTKKAQRSVEALKREQLMTVMRGQGGKPGSKLSDDEFIKWFVDKYAKADKKSEGYTELQKFVERQQIGAKALQGLTVNPATEAFARNVFTKEVNASWVYIAAKTPDADGLAAAQKTATALHDAISKDPKSFAVKAKASSDDFATKMAGGSLGWAKGDVGYSEEKQQKTLPPVLEYLVFATKPGEMSPVMHIYGTDTRSQQQMSMPLLGYAFVKVDSVRDRTDMPKDLTWKSIGERFTLRTMMNYQTAFSTALMNAETYKIRVVRKAPELRAYDARTNNNKKFLTYAREALGDKTVPKDVIAGFAYTLAAQEADNNEKIQLLTEAVQYGGRQAGKIYVDMAKAYLALGKKEDARMQLDAAVNVTDIGLNAQGAAEIRSLYKELGDTEGLKRLDEVILDNMTSEHPK